MSYQTTLLARLQHNITMLTEQHNASAIMLGEMKNTYQELWALLAATRPETSPTPVTITPVADVAQHRGLDVAPQPSGVDEPKQTEQTVVTPVEMRQIDRENAIKEKLTYMTATGRCMKVTKSSKVPNGANLSLGGAALGVFVSDPPKVKKVRGKKGTPAVEPGTRTKGEVRSKPLVQSSAAQQTVASPPVVRPPLVVSDYLTVGPETIKLVNPQQISAAKAIFASCVIPGSVGLQRIRTLQKAVGITLPRSFEMTIDGVSKTVSIIGNPDAPNSVNVSR